MEKPGNLFATVKIRKIPPNNKEYNKGRNCILTQNFPLGKFSVLAWGNQPPGFSVRGTSTPNELFQTIKILMTPSNVMYCSI